MLLDTSSRGVLGATGLVIPVGVLQFPLAHIRAIESVTSPVTRAFQVPLPIPSVLAPVHSDEEADYYEITQKPGIAHILPGLSTPIWGYNGIFPGPTIEARSGRKAIVRQRNELPVLVSTHLHGGVTPPESDGHPMDFILPKDPSPFRASLINEQMLQFMSSRLGRSLHMQMQQTKEYVYPNTQRASIHWYHDHRMDFTGPQIYQGLAGFYLIRDEVDEALPLPKGDHDIPLMITDHIFNADGSFFYPSLDPTLTTTPGVLGKYDNGMVGDTILVNGAVQPFLEVSTTKYRFRLLNASNARVYQLELSSHQPLTQIGSDAGLLPAPAERFDATPRLGATEIWEFTSDSNHPIHMHLVDFQVLSRDGRAPDPEDMGYKDTVFPPMQSYSLKSRKNTRLTTIQKSMMSYTGAGLCFVSEFIHLWLLPEQYETYLVYGIIFLLIAMTQGFIGANLLFDPRRRLLTFGLWVNVLIIVLYGFTHIIGVLVGLAFFPLPIDTWGITATMTEVVAVIILLFLQHNIPRIRRSKDLYEPFSTGTRAKVRCRRRYRLAGVASFWA